jgi:hypothetical protein
VKREIRLLCALFMFHLHLPGREMNWKLQSNTVRPNTSVISSCTENTVWYYWSSGMNRGQGAL